MTKLSEARKLALSHILWLESVDPIRAINRKGAEHAPMPDARIIEEFGEEALAAIREARELRARFFRAVYAHVGADGERRMAAVARLSRARKEDAA